MFNRKTRRSLVCLTVAGLLAVAGTTFPRAEEPDRESAAADSPDIDRRVQELERQLAELKARLESGDAAPSDADLDELQRRIEILSREIETLRIGDAAVEADESIFGFGPAASKVYKVDKGVSIGGYGEYLYQNFDSDRDDGSPGKTDEFDFLRAVLYFGYKFNDRIIFNSEIEYEHASTSNDGSVALEFAYFDFLFNDRVNARTGLLLAPMGFINELHEPPIFLGARRPDVERVLLPTTWRENGAGVFGDLGPVSYRAYVMNGFDGAGLDESGFSAGGLRGGRQKGSKALAEDFAFVARADWEIVTGLTLGGAFYTGDAGQGAVAPTTGETIDATTDILEAHIEWRWRGLEARGLWVDVDIDDADLINDFQDPDRLTMTPSASVGDEMNGHYLQVGYDVLAQRNTDQAVIPFVRYEEYDTQDSVPTGFARNPANDVEVWTYGVSYKPINNVVFKLDYQDYDNGAGTGQDQWNLAMGFLF